MRTNNFKRLEEEEFNNMPEPPAEIQNNIVGQVNLFRFIGDIIELYLPKVVDLFVQMSGGDQSSARRSPEKHGPFDGKRGPDSIE